MKLNRYQHALHLHVNRDRVRNLNAFVLAEAFQAEGLVPIWYRFFGFKIPCTTPHIDFRGAHLVSGNRDVAEFLGNKWLFKQRLKQQQIGVAEGKAFTASRVEQAYSYFSQLEGDCVIKPAWGNQGKGVTVGIHPADTEHGEFLRAFEHAHAHGHGKNLVIIERKFTGDQEARFLVVGGETISSFRRTAPTVLGDGVSTISELIAEKNGIKAENPNECRLPIQLDAHRLKVLKRQGFNDESVPLENQWVRIDYKGSISAGGDTIECTKEVHPSYFEIAAKVAQLASPVVVVGVDIMANDFTQQATAENYCVLEANSGPAITGHIYPSFGEPADVINPILDYCFAHYEVNYDDQTIYEVVPEIVTLNTQARYSAMQYVLNLATQAQGFGVEVDTSGNTPKIRGPYSRLCSISRLFAKQYHPSETALLFTQEEA